MNALLYGICRLLTIYGSVVEVCFVFLLRSHKGTKNFWKPSSYMSVLSPRYESVNSNLSLVDGACLLVYFTWRLLNQMSWTKWVCRLIGLHFLKTYFMFIFYKPRICIPSSFPWEQCYSTRRTMQSNVLLRITVLCAWCLALQACRGIKKYVTNFFPFSLLTFLSFMTLFRS